MKQLLQKSRRIAYGFILLAVTGFSTFAQRSVTGKVKGNNSETLAGVSIFEKQTKKGTTTGLDGSYKIDVPANSILVFSFVGFKSQEVTIGNKTNVNVELAVDVQALEEIVVVGYGQVKKSDLTASVSSIKGDVIKEFPVSSLDQALQGRIAGVQV